MSNFNAYCVKLNYHIVYSDRSSVTTQFGTDIQIREGFGGHIFQNLVFFVAITILFLVILFSFKRP